MFQQGIAYEILPKTFQDAVVFTRKLGYRFLWIDSLCIVQDDSEDWLAEAGRMAGIYEHAALTLAAASSTDSVGGLFRKSTPEALIGHGKEGKTQLAVRQFSNPVFFEYGHRQSALEKPGKDQISPLMKRAWIYQERMLSGQILFFTPLELVFECRVSSKTESGYPWIDSRPKHTFTSVYSSERSTNFPLLWRQLVAQFTQLQLSLNNDRLSAIAGIATRLSERLTGGESMSYFAGSWRETFIQDMLWESSTRIGNSPPRINECIPTWSWARSDLPKTYRYGSGNPKALSRLEEVVCAPLGSSNNYFTGISSGYTVVSGYLLPAKMKTTGIVIDKNPRVHHRPEMDYDWSTEGQEKISDGDDLFVLPLMASQEAEHDVQIHALILRRCNPINDAFKRIGIFGLPISVHHLQGHHYIFEEGHSCLDVYRRLISYGKSLLGPDGLYLKSAEKGPVNPRWLAPDAEILEKDFFNQAEYRHLCLYGPSSNVKLKDFLGQMHLDVLEAEMSTERDRAEEWQRRNKQGEEQVHRRIPVKIV
ncbi:HET-domain-containing protein [Penicillium sp. IBT 35674x]|nr:HET-domain-containing protein [Penicillium sp. IBT 35674x]